MQEDSFREHIYTSFSLQNAPMALPALPHICGYENAVISEFYKVDGREMGFRHRIMFQYTLSGCGELEFQGKIRKVPPGSALLLEIPGDFQYRISPTAKRWEHFFVSFPDPISIELGTSLIREYGNIVVLSDSHATLTALQALYAVLKGEDATNPLVVSGAGYHVLMSLALELQNCSKMQRGKVSLLALSNAYCMAHLSKKITVQELAAHCGFTRSHFSRSFAAETGMAPTDYITEFKLHIAETILTTDSTVTIKELASKCGISDHSYFCRIFKKRYHLSPREYLHKRACSPADATS